MLVYTRAMFRDAVRRGFSQIPPIDTGSGVAGAQPVRNPWPTNPGINMMLDFSASDLSRQMKKAGDVLPRSIPIAAQTANTPFVIALQSIAPPMQITSVKRVAWFDGSGTNEARLTSTSREAMDYQLNVSSMNPTPGTPQRYWVEAGNLLIWPAPLDDGTLSLMCGQALWSESQSLDGEVPELIPTDHYPYLVNLTISKLCTTQPEDQVLQTLKAEVERDMVQQKADWLTYCATQDRGYQGHFRARTGRTGMLRRAR